jgi:hypothetical protein
MEETMRKHSKFITILLSALLAVCLVQTVFVQAFATEMGDDDFGWGNASTSDEAETVYPVSMKVVKAPKTVTVHKGISDEITDEDFWKNVVLHIVYSNGEEYDVNCDGIDSEDGVVLPIADTGDITADHDVKDDTVDFTVSYWYGDGDYISVGFSVDIMRPVSMKVVKAPESITVNQDRITDSTFWSNVVLHIVYSNGEEYDVNCDGIGDSYENGIVPPIPEIDGYSGRIYIYSESMLDNYLDNDVAFHLRYRYGVDSELVDEGGYDGIFIETEFSVKKKVDPHTIAKCEVTKLPDKVFTAPLFTAEDEPLESLDVKNSISHNIDGMEITYYYANGEKGGTVTFNSSMLSEDFAPVAVRYGTQDLDEYGNYIRIEVHDEGNYKFSVEYLDYPNISAQILTAKSASNPNPSIKPVSTIDTPEKPSDNISSATSDVATKDNAGNNKTTNGTANNGVVATGDFATPAIIATVMILAAAVMFVLKRKHTF